MCCCKNDELMQLPGWQGMPVSAGRTRFPSLEPGGQCVQAALDTKCSHALSIGDRILVHKNAYWILNLQACNTAGSELASALCISQGDVAYRAASVKVLSCSCNNGCVTKVNAHSTPDSLERSVQNLARKQACIGRSNSCTWGAPEVPRSETCRATADPLLPRQGGLRDLG